MGKWSYEELSEALERYPKVLQECKPKAAGFHDAYEAIAGAALKRKPVRVEQKELVTVMQWKLARGKWKYMPSQAR